MRSHPTALRLLAPTLTLAIVLIAAAGCRSSRQAQSESRLTSAERTALFARALEQMPPIDFLSARVKATVALGSGDVSMSGSLKMKKNEAIQLSLSMMGLIEVASIEFRPAEVLVINRVQRSYARCPYEQFPLFRQAGVDFGSLQALFTNRLFLPGDNGRHTLKKSDFELTGQPAGLAATATKGDTQVQFLIDREARLAATTATYAQSYRLQCDYGDFGSLLDAPFAQSITLAFSGGRHSAGLALKLSNPKSDNFVWKPLAPSSSYKQVSIEQVLQF